MATAVLVRRITSYVTIAETVLTSAVNVMISVADAMRPRVPSAPNVEKSAPSVSNGYVTIAVNVPIARETKRIAQSVIFVLLAQGIYATAVTDAHGVPIFARNVPKNARLVLRRSFVPNVIPATLVSAETVTGVRNVGFVRIALTLYAPAEPVQAVRPSVPSVEKNVPTAPTMKFAAAVTSVRNVSAETVISVKNVIPVKTVPSTFAFAETDARNVPSSVPIAEKNASRVPMTSFAPSAVSAGTVLAERVTTRRALPARAKAG